jgi:ABC-type Fe3+/spermidine/putrescine transport system ATPase subunit
MTFIYVTHDQEEALTMSDRIAVMSNARIAQLGSPAEIYENPRTAFVAKFIGESNFFSGAAEGRNGTTWSIRMKDGESFRVPDHPLLAPGKQIQIAVRPEWMDVVHPGNVPEGENSVSGKVREILYLGETLHVVVTLFDGTDITVALRNEGQIIKPLGWKIGDSAVLAWLPEDCQILETE